jgi:hypothetical protein
LQSGSLDQVLPEGSSQNADFVADMKMEKASWFYTGNQRFLLVMKPTDKNDAEADAVKEEWRVIGSKACVAVQGKKLDAIKVLFTQGACQDQVGLGCFANAFILSNF